jgi:hypothetical protein
MRGFRNIFCLCHLFRNYTSQHTYNKREGYTAVFFPFYAFDVDHHHWLVVREAILGEEVGEYSVHFERLPRYRGGLMVWGIGF